jgi:uncharacterized phage protein gp47/JayE
MTTTSQPVPFPSPVLQIPTSIDYTSRDYTGIAQSLIIYAQQAMPDWNMSSEGDFGVMLLELFAYMGDIMSYYIDRVAQEAYINTATQRLSLLNIAGLLGYVPHNGSPSSGTVTFTTSATSPAVIVPSLSQLQSNFNSALDTPVLFYTTEEVTVPEDGGTITVPVNQGQWIYGEIVGTSGGASGQQFQLASLGIQDQSTLVYVQSSQGILTWTQVLNFVDNGPNDMVYTASVNQNGVTTITFGDGINGLIPPLGAQITSTYIVIVGSAGNIAAGAVTLFLNDVPGVSIQVISGIAQSSIMSGGADPESNNSIRGNAPEQFATQQRAVSLNDFASLALAVQGVTMANAVANHSTSVSLYVLGPGGSMPTTGLLNNVQDYFIGPPQRLLAGVTLTTPLPNLIMVDVGSTANNIQLEVLSNYSAQNTLNSVNSALNALLSPPNVAFGQLLQVSSIYEAIMAVAGVAYVVIPVFTREDIVQTGTNAIQFRQSEVPIPGSFFVTVNGGM